MKEFELADDFYAWGFEVKFDKPVTYEEKCQVYIKQNDLSNAWNTFCRAKGYIVELCITDDTACTASSTSADIEVNTKIDTYIAGEREKGAITRHNKLSSLVTTYDEKYNQLCKLTKEMHDKFKLMIEKNQILEDECVDLMNNQSEYESLVKTLTDANTQLIQNAEYPTEAKLLVQIGELKQSNLKYQLEIKTLLKIIDNKRQKFEELENELSLLCTILALNPCTRCLCFYILYYLNSKLNKQVAMGRMLLSNKKEIKNNLNLHKKCVKLDKEIESTETRYEMQIEQLHDKYETKIRALSLKIGELCGNAIGEPLQTARPSQPMRQLPLDKIEEMTNEWCEKYDNFMNNDKKQQENE